MNTNIEITNINKSLFPISRKTSNKKKYITKTVNKCFYSINEANICEKVKKIPYYLNNYLIVENIDFVNIGQLYERNIETLNLPNEKQYLLFSYRNDNLIDFNVFLFNFSVNCCSSIYSSIGYYF